MKNTYLIPLLILLFCSTSIAQISFEEVGGSIPFTAIGYNECVVDMNGDFLDDIVVIGNFKMTQYLQQENGEFEVKETDWGFNTLPTWSICAGDFDENGFNDLVLGDFGSVSFYMASADGSTYEEIYDPTYIFAQRSTTADIDNDGDLDAFVCNDDAINFPYFNDGSGKMTLDTDRFPTADMAGNYSAMWVDYDNDGDSDLFLTKCYVFTTSVNDPERINLLYRNDGNGSFTEVGEEANMNDNAQSWTTNFEDYDNDGDFDAFIVNHDFKNRLMINNGDGTFTDTIRTTNINASDLGAWESTSYDFDNNGYVDILSELNERIYYNFGNLEFIPSTEPVPFEAGGVGDLNNDGFMDIVTDQRVYFNQGNDNNWVKFSPVGISSNRNGIGARVEIYGEWGRQIREVRSSQSFSKMNTLNCHFGIGAATTIDSLVVLWPSGIKTVQTDVEINKGHTIYEFDCLLSDIEISTPDALEICAGETVTITAPAGYNYSWSNGAESPSITVEEGGLYTVTVNDGSECFGVSNAIQVVTLIDTPPTIVPSGSIDICAGEVITVNAITNNSEGMWSTGQSNTAISVSQPGEYNFQIQAACIDELLQSETLFINHIEVNNPVAIDQTVNTPGDYTLMAEGENLLWYLDETSNDIIGTGNILIATVNGTDVTRWVESAVQSYTGEICRSERIPVTAYFTSSSQELLAELGVQVFPNPVVNQLNIMVDNHEELISLQLLTQAGKVVKSNNVNFGIQNTIQVNDLPAGTYSLRIESTLGLATMNVLIAK